MIVFNSSGLESVFNVRSLATYLAGSQYITWLSLSDVSTSIAGYAPRLRLSYGEYERMYLYAFGSLGLPHSRYSPTVSGRSLSSIVVITSTNGTCETTALNR